MRNLINLVEAWSRRPKFISPSWLGTSISVSPSHISYKGSICQPCVPLSAGAQADPGKGKGNGRTMFLCEEIFTGAGMHGTVLGTGLHHPSLRVLSNPSRPGMDETHLNPRISLSDVFQDASFPDPCALDRLALWSESLGDATTSDLLSPVSWPEHCRCWPSLPARQRELY